MVVALQSVLCGLDVQRLESEQWSNSGDGEEKKLGAKLWNKNVTVHSESSVNCDCTFKFVDVGGH